MMASTVWSRLRSFLGAGSAGGGDRIRGVTARLALLSVALLLVMVIVLEVVVYLTSQEALRRGLEGTLKSRAAQVDPTVCQELRLNCGFGRFPNNRGRPPPSGGNGQPGGGFGQPGGGPGGGAFQHGGSGGPGPVRADLTPSDATSVFVNSSARVIHFDGVLGRVLLDPQAARQAISSRAPQCCSTHPYKGTDYLVYTAPLIANGRSVGAVQTSISQNQFESSMNTIQHSLLLVALLGLLVSAGISAFLARRALRPIRVAVQRQRDFVADAAHELRTPLAIMRTVGEVGLTSSSSEELQGTVAQMLSENQHLTRLVEDLSLLARTDTNTVAIERRPVDLSSLVADTTEELRYLAEEQGVDLDTTLQDGVRVTGDTLRLRQLLLILLDNALKHTPAGGTVNVDLTLHGSRTRLRVTDSGSGIDPKDISRIFDRFYRADESREGEGSGLGLAIAKWIVDAHGGQIHAGNTAPHGAAFTVTLPATRAIVPLAVSA